jgi:pimeloyl-ACP methyl ester carboxylesterase
MDGVVRRQVSLDDVELSLLAAGIGPPVVLLHGSPTGAELWRGVLPKLAGARLHALAPDLPGYGRTRLPHDADHGLAAAAELLARWLQETAAQPAWVVGHDLGGAVAQMLAVRHPDLVSALTLVNSVAHGSWPAPRARFASLAARAGLHRAMAGAGVIPNPYLRRQLRRGFSDPEAARSRDLERVVFDGKFSDPEGRAAFERHLADLTSRDTAAVVDRLAALPMPCQLVWGAEDPFQSWEDAGRLLLGQLPDPDVTILEGCGHLTPLECPRQLAAALLDWHVPTA